MIYFTSDLHFCHNREFLFGPRGFTNVADMNAAIVERWNKKVKPEDEVYILGDLMLNDNVEGMRLLQCLNGKLHVILGNHDTEERIKLYKKLPNKIIEVAHALPLKYDGYHFFLCHYPTYTANIDDTHKTLKQRLICLYGHTHQQTNWFDNHNPFMYHVGLDSHNCTPVSIDEIIAEISTMYESYKMVIK